MLRHPGCESGLLTPTKSTRPYKRAFLQGLLQLTPELLRNLIKYLLGQLSSPPKRIQQEEAHCTIGDQGRQLVGRQDGIAAGEASQRHHRLIRRENDLVCYPL